MSAQTRLLVVGAGPTGLALALAAHDHGASVRIVDRRADPFRPSRALIMHARTLEALRPLGVAGVILARAVATPVVRLHLGRRTVPVDLDALEIPDTPMPPLALVRQMDVETALLDALAARGIAVERGAEVVAVSNAPGDARATLRTPAGIEEVACDAIAGCDGPTSAVRCSAGIAWEGGPYREEIVLADLELRSELAPGSLNAFVGRRGLLLIFPLGERATWRLLATRPAGDDPQPYGQAGPPVPADQVMALMRAAGFLGEIAELAWSARYRIQHRVAGGFRAGRLFIAGDAAHTWSPATGQGMNTGIQDAVNLGWKLAGASRSSDPDRLLDTYEAERRPAATRLFRLTHIAFWAEAGSGPVPSLLRAAGPLGAPLLPLLLGRRRLLGEGIAAMSRLRAGYRDSALSIERTPPRAGFPRAGDRLPDRVASVDGHSRRLHEVIAHPGVSVLLQSGTALPEGCGRDPLVAVHRLDAVPGKGLVAVRPDGYIGYRGDGSGLRAWLALAGFDAADTDRSRPPTP